MSSKVAPLAIGVPIAIGATDDALHANGQLTTEHDLQSQTTQAICEIKDSAGDVATFTRERLDRLHAHPLSRTMPGGLSRAMCLGCSSFPLRVVIVDNSGSMNTPDGQRIVQGGDGAGAWWGNHSGMRRLSCTRWQELGEEIVQMAQMATALRARTDFHMLNPKNGYDILSVCPSSYTSLVNQGVSADVEMIQAATRTSPCGTTPLTESVMRIVAMIEPHARDLHARGERVAVIIATDGLPNNRSSFVSAMQALQRLPVWVIVRLCTDDDSIVDYWNDLDRNLESPLEVLDDLRSEAVEVERLNPWLTYGGPLHLCRLFGMPGKLFDALDESSLLPFQIKEFVEDLLGITIGHDPQVDKDAFLNDVKEALAEVPPVLHPITLQPKPWLDLNRLERAMRPKQQGCVLL